MNEIVTAVVFTDKLLEVFGLVKAGKIERNKEVDLAMEKVFEAVVETQSYVKISRVGNRNEKREKKLSKLWRAASIPLWYVDEELSRICGLKGRYWSNPDEWDDIRSGDLNISLSNVEYLIDDLLANRKI